MPRIFVPLSLLTAFVGLILWSAGAVPPSIVGETNSPLPSPTDSVPLQLIDSESIAAQTRYLELLERGLKHLRESRDYTATLRKQERVDGELLPSTTGLVRVRHQPHSVYLNWDDLKREAIYVEGENDNKLKARNNTLPRAFNTLNLDPTGMIAMADSRYPITKLGLLPLTETLVEYRKRDLGFKSGVVCRVTEGAEFDGHPCIRIVAEYATPQVDPTYRKSIAYLDRQLGFPRSITNYGWPSDPTQSASGSLDSDTLIEDYAYRDLKFNQDLGDTEFQLEARTLTFRRNGN